MNSTIIALKNKTNCQLKKANKQLDGRGLIYLVWDYNMCLHGDDGQVHRGVINKEGMQKLINEIVDDFIKCHPYLDIKNYYFGDLRDLVIDLHV